MASSDLTFYKWCTPTENRCLKINQKKVFNFNFIEADSSVKTQIWARKQLFFKRFLRIVTFKNWLKMINSMLALLFLWCVVASTASEGNLHIFN
jgi:hypothetical protein